MPVNSAKKQDGYLGFTKEMSRIISEIKQGEMKRPILISGGSDFMVLKTVRYLTQLCEKTFDSTAIHADLNEFSENEFQELFTSSSLFEPEQLYVLGRCELQNRLEKYITNKDMPETSSNRFIFSVGKGKLSVKLLKQVRDLKWEHLQCLEPSPHQASQYIRQTAKFKGLNVNQEAAQLLLEVVGTSLPDIENELNRLLLVQGEEKLEITSEFVRAHCQLLREEDSFQISDYLVSGSPAKAEALIYQLIDRGTQPISILGLLSRLIRQIIQFKIDANSRSIRMPSHVRSKYARFAKTKKISDMKSALSLCQTADVRCKSGRGAARLTLSEVLLFLH